MASRTRIDENSQFNHIGGLAAKNVALGLTRRPALGDLVNRAPKPNAAVAEPTKKGVTVNTENENIPIAGIIDLKKVKPRVDTHWTKPMTRSNSIKTATVPSNAKVEATSALAAGPKLLKARTTTTASIREVKYISTTKATAVAVKKEKSKSPDRPVIKRQESNLSRKSLTKIRSTSTTTVVAVKTENISNVKASDGNAAIRKKVQAPKSIESVAPIVQSTNYYSAHSANMLGQFNDINIDAGDESNPLLVSEYVNDIYSYLYHLETVYAIEKNHLEGQRDVLPKMRAVLMDWINEVHLQYHFVQETFHMAVSIIDRYLQTVKSTSRQNLQLVGVAALFISSKYEELYPPEITDFVYITDDTYTKHQVIEMEKHILKKLKFELGSPLPIHFLRRYSKAAMSDATTHVMSKYFIELAAIDYQLCEYLPSQIAAASLFIALCINNKPYKQSDYEALWTQALEYYTTCSLKDLMPIIQKLAGYILNAPTAKLNNVYKKYRSSKFQEIASKAEKSANILKNIINFAF